MNTSDGDTGLYDGIVDDFMRRCREGRQPSPEEFARCYPQFAQAIHNDLPVLAIIEKVKNDVIEEFCDECYGASIGKLETEPSTPRHEKQTPAPSDDARAATDTVAAQDETLDTKIPVPLLPAESSDYWRFVARIGIQVASVLAHAHSRGTIHRDIEPSNLLMDNNGTVWVTDFGLATLADGDDLTQSGDMLGTLRYQSPGDGKRVCCYSAIHNPLPSP